MTVNQEDVNSFMKIKYNGHYYVKSLKAKHLGIPTFCFILHHCSIISTTHIQ